MRELRLHVFENKNRSIDKLVTYAQQVFDLLDIRINVVAKEKFNALTDVRTGTSDLADLRKVVTARSKVIPVFYVLTIYPPDRGATVADPLVLLGANVTLWTLAHELGHVLLGSKPHSTKQEEVMGPTTNVNEPPPDFTEKERETILRSDLLFETRLEASLTVSKEAVSKEDVLAFLQYDDTDYEEAASLGLGALPHLSAFVENAAADPGLAAAAVYLAAKIGKAEAEPIIASAAHPSRPRSVRIAAAGAIEFLPSAQSETTVLRSLDSDDQGLRKMVLQSIKQGASKAVLERLQQIAAEEPDEVLRRLAVHALMEQT